MVNMTPANASGLPACLKGSPWFAVAPVKICMVSGICMACAASQNLSYQRSEYRRSDGAVLARDVTLPGDRDEIRDRSTTVGMHLLRRLLRGEEFPF